MTSSRYLSGLATGVGLIVKGEEKVRLYRAFSSPLQNRYIRAPSARLPGRESRCNQYNLATGKIAYIQISYYPQVQIAIGTPEATPRRTGIEKFDPLSIKVSARKYEK